MPFSDLIKPTALLLLAASGGFLGAYFSVSPEVPKASVDTRELESASAKLALSAEQFEVLQKNIQSLVAEKEHQATAFQKREQDYLTQVNLLSSQLAELRQLISNSSTTPATDTQVTAACSEEQLTQHLKEQLDYDSLQSAIDNMYSTDFNDRQRALRTLVLVGTDDIKDKIGEIILDENEDTALRRDLIQSMDWGGFSSVLIDLFNSSKDSSIRGAAVSAIDNSHLGQDEIQAIENSLVANFADESDDFVRIVTLDYFSNHNSPYLQELSSSLDGQELSQQLREHIQFLNTPAPEAAPENIPAG